MKIKSSRFVQSAPRYQLLPYPSTYPEVVLIGRSNVGKSSLINRLLQRKNLARTGMTPGHTRLFNLFEVCYSSSKGGRDRFAGLIDCPGFGFSRMSKREQAERESEFITLLQKRISVKVVCLLNDCRRLPGAEELALRDFIFESEKALVVCLTKWDVLNRREQEKAIREISQSYGLEKEDVVITGTSLSPDGVWQRILPLLGTK